MPAMLELIAGLGPVAVFLLMIAESACIPVPSEAIMLGGGALASGAVAGVAGGGLSQLTLFVLAGVLGNLVGAGIAYAVGRYAGQAAVHRWGRYVRLSEHDIQRAHGWFARYGSASVFFGRMLTVVRTFISLPAGFARMGALRFGVYTFVGSIPWVGALGVVGYEIGQNWHGIAHAFHDAAYLVAAAAVLGVLIGAWTWLRRRRRTAEARHAGRAEPEQALARTGPEE
jgi:membrane protein DedA with SNARE-associated domain